MTPSGIFPGIKKRRGKPHQIPLIHRLLTHLLEDALVEELLQFLIAVIDAELLEAVVLEIFLEKKK